MIQKISRDKAKTFALRIYEQIPKFCNDNLQEYVLFLQGRAHISEKAKEELDRIKGDK